MMQPGKDGDIINETALAINANDGPNEGEEKNLVSGGIESMIKSTKK